MKGRAREASGFGGAGAGRRHAIRVAHRCGFPAVARVTDVGCRNSKMAGVRRRSCAGWPRASLKTKFHRGALSAPLLRLQNLGRKLRAAKTCRLHCAPFRAACPARGEAALPTAMTLTWCPKVHSNVISARGNGNPAKPSFPRRREATPHKQSCTQTRACRQHVPANRIRQLVSEAPQNVPGVQRAACSTIDRRPPPNVFQPPNMPTVIPAVNAGITVADRVPVSPCGAGPSSFSLLRAQASGPRTITDIITSE